MFDCCLVSSLSPMVFYYILLPMFSAGRSPASLLLVCVPPRPTAAWLLLRSAVPYHSLFLLLLLRPGRRVRLLFFSTSLLSWLPISRSAKSFLTGYFDAQVSGFRCPSPAPPRLFLTGYFDAQISGFRCLSPAPPRLFLTGYFAAQVSGFPVPLSRSATSFSDRLFWRPGIRFSVPFSRSATSSSDRLFGHPGIRFSGALLPLRHDSSDRLFWRPGLPFPVPQGLLFAPCFWCPWSSFDTLLFFPPNLPFPVTWVAGSLFVPPCGSPAVFTAPLSPFFWGGSALPPPSCLLPPSLRPLPGAPCGAGSSIASPVGRHSWPSFVPPGWPLSERYRSSHRFPFCAFPTH